MVTNSKNLHLLISAIVITIVALTYGLSPASNLPLIFDFKVESTDLKGVFRATMGLYLGMSGLWVAYYQTVSVEDSDHYECVLYDRFGDWTDYWSVVRWNSIHGFCNWTCL